MDAVVEMKKSVINDFFEYMMFHNNYFFRRKFKLITQQFIY